MSPLDSMLDDVEIECYASNILARYDRTDEVLRAAGRGWYAAANLDCGRLAARYGLTLEQVAGAAAAISPGMKWELVLHYVERLILKRGRKLDFNVPTYSLLFVNRARQCLKGKDQPSEILGGPKVTAFYTLLCNPRDAWNVCVDGHAFNIAKGKRTPIRGAGSEDGKSLTDRRYKLVAEAYRRAAAARGIIAHQMQASTWVAHRAIDQHSAGLPF